MFSALKNLLGIRTTEQSIAKSTESALFSGSAYFSNRVPEAFTEIWMAHGGAISSGTTLDARARYFFAMDPSESWVTKLFAKSVVVIHAGWIIHCVDEAFRVPIAEYVLDGRPFYAVILLRTERFVPGPPYKLTNITPSMYVPLAEPGGSSDGESELMAAQTSDTPSTPTSMRLKRKQEQAYFDSPSGSLVFSGFDKDGVPRRPRKKRKLRFDPSFSPDGGRYGRETKQGSGPAIDWLRDLDDTLRDDAEFDEERGQDTGTNTLCGPSQVPMIWPLDTPDKYPARGGQSAAHERLSSGEHLSKTTRVASPATSTDIQEKMPPIRTIDFTKLPPPTRRWRFPQSDATNSGGTGTILSVVKPADYKVKTPKKISFANHARVCVYTVSPQRPDARDGPGASSPRQRFGEESNDGPKLNDRTRMSSDGAQDPDDSTVKAIKDLPLHTDSPKIHDEPVRLLGGDQFENDTLTLTMGDVQALRRSLLESAAKNGVDDDRLATLFGLEKTCRGMSFRHVW